MKKSLFQRRNLTIIFTLGLLMIASVSFAHMGGWGYDGDDGPRQPSLSADQQQKLDAIQEKYAPQLNDLGNQISSKREEYRAARAKDDTTVGTLNKLDKEIDDLSLQYRDTLAQANREAGQVYGDNFGPWTNCPNYGGNARGGMGYGGPMGYGGHMGYGGPMGYGMMYGRGYGMGR